MDAFTEGILERARERQRKLLECNTEAPLRDLNIKATSTPAISSGSKEFILERKNGNSDSNLCVKSPVNSHSLCTTAPEGNLSKISRQNSKTRISTEMPGSPKPQFKTLNVQKENFNMEIKLCSAENVRIEVEFQEEDDGAEGKENLDMQSRDQCNTETPALREGVKKRLQKLGKLYAGGDDAELSSPIYRTEGEFSTNISPKKISIPEEDEQRNKTPAKGRKGLRGLAVLADTINKWEDDLSEPKKENDIKEVPQKRSWKSPAPRPPISQSQSVSKASVKVSSPRTKPQAPKPPSDVKTDKVNESQKSDDSGNEHSKQLNLDPSLVEVLKCQGFTRTHSNSRLIYDYGSEYNKIEKASTEVEQSSRNLVQEIKEENLEALNKKSERLIENKLEISHSPVRSKRGASVADKAAIFESVSSPSKSTNKDPALLSVSERKALFEKNKGAAPVPKAPISQAAPINSDKIAKSAVKKPTTSPVKETSANLSKTKSSEVVSRGVRTEVKNPIKCPAPRPPIHADTSDDSAYRVAPGHQGGIASKVAALFKNKSTISQQQIESSIREQRQREMDVLLNRFQKNKVQQAVPDESESESDNEDATETTAMITQNPAEIMKSPETIPPPPPPPGPSGNTKNNGGKRCSKEDSPKVAAVLDDVKRIKVSSSNKPGRLYPCLSDIETATETEVEQNSGPPTPSNSSFQDNYESDVDAAETSFGREILQTVCKNITPQKRPIYDESTESDATDILDDMDDYLDEAAAYNADQEGPTPPKRRSTSPTRNGATKPSSSFQYKNFTPTKASPQINSPVKDFKSPSKVVSPRQSEEFTTYVVDGDSVLPLTHTVSFYRKQQTQGFKTPVRQIIRTPIVEKPENQTLASSAETLEVKTKIQQLLEEMTKQQTIISQTSQALNLCYSTPEFTGSTEQVEAEKVLLLATHRRAAAQREIERLSVMGTLHPETKQSDNVPLEKGKLVISNIVLPLKKEYVRALNATGGKGHHVVCLVKCADQVHATQLVSTVATNDRNPNLELSVPGYIQFNNVYSNFTAQFEVYCLQAQEEILPHEVKYHIHNKKSNHKMTPKKGKSDSRLLFPPKESPGGPQAVRTSTFAVMGYIVFSIQAVNRKNWTLNNTPSMSPLEGIVEMRVKCELAISVEHRGFLTMFEDVSGFGAWHRRWCLLKGHVLSYWKYPDEERKKAPINSIDLSDCITQNIGPVRRDICARPHTLLVETTRPAHPQDKDSLVMECRGDATIIRHLLSVDSKEERVEWSNMFNKALTSMKMCKVAK